MRFGTGHGSFEIDDLPGCTQVGVSHSVWVNWGERGKGLGQADHVERLAKCKELGYDLLLCTVDKANLVQKHILSKFGWVRLTTYVSSKTQHEVEIWSRSL